MMQQYFGAKDAYPDCILFFRMGDFFEMFYDDAEVASRELDLTLTSRDKDEQGAVPMAGVPWHAARTYIARLIEKGYKVAVCDQIEDPAKAKGLVRREVVQVITPGVVLDSETLDAREANFLAAVSSGPEAAPPYGLAYLDVSTGDFSVTLAGTLDALLDEVSRVGPRQVLLPEHEALAAVGRVLPAAMCETVDAARFDVRRARRLLERREGAEEGAGSLQRIESFGFAAADRAISAAGCVLGYVEETSASARRHIRPARCYSLAETMVLDEATRVNLELHRTIRDGRRAGSLLGAIDRTKTAMGARLLKRWLAYPLLDPTEIDRRLDSVADLVESPLLREELREVLGGMGDLERLAGRISSAMAGPRELSALRTSAEALPAVRALLLGGEGAGRAAPLSELAEGLDDLSDLAARVAEALVDDPPATLKDGGVIRPGHSPDLDEVVEAATRGKDWILGLEAEERRRTGIASLKVRYNRVFGYYLEVSRANLHLVPEDYIRKQTLANAERFYTPRLKELEEKVLTAEERRTAMETELFETVREAVAAQATRIQESAAKVATLDVLAGLADVAHRQDYCRPVVDNSEVLLIEDGRHPVVERMLRDERFVPNGVALDTTEREILIVTGPNMAGKSTVLRQTALIVLMGQMGSFVPARSARIGVVDRVFTRVGASDDLARGQSTFMVEMIETAGILAHATRRSLVVLDEIGRGTSTFDGVSIAWAVAEYLHDRIGCRALFATHYHELTELSVTRERVHNVSVAVKEWQDEVVFLRRLVEGGANRSYGIQVARLAGLPTEVIERAREVLGNLEACQIDATSRPAIARSSKAPAPAQVQFDLFAGRPVPSEVEDALRALDPETLTPLEALNLIYSLKAKLGAK